MGQVRSGVDHEIFISLTYLFLIVVSYFISEFEARYDDLIYSARSSTINLKYRTIILVLLVVWYGKEPS